MNREDVGFWGVDLDADAFAQALAAAGVLTASGIRIDDSADTSQLANLLRDVIDAVEPGGAVRWAVPKTPGIAAGTFAAAWSSATAGNPGLRLEIDPGGEAGRRDPAWAVAQLSRPAVGLAAVFVAPPFPPHPIAREAWHWPLDAGLLPDDDSRRLGDAIFREGIPGEVVELLEVGPAREACDLLLLPFDAREALIRLLKVPVRASCVVILGAGNEPWERLRPMLETMVAHARASSIVVARVPADARMGWFNTVIQELANDAGLDVALHRATPGVPPLVIAPDRLLRRTRMGVILREMREMAMAMPPEEAATAGADIAAIGDDESTMAVPPPFAAPTAGAGAPPRAARIARAGRSVRAHRPEPEPRFLQARLATPDEPDRAVPTLQPDGMYLVTVRVGPEGAGWLHSGTQAPVEHLFAGDDEEHTLRVFFTDLTTESDAQAQSIVLRREGASTTATFHLRARDAGSRIEARIVLMHRNRVLQTVKLRAVVGEADSAKVTDEVVARGRLDDLSGRSRFDLAFIVNHTDAGERRLTAVAGERAAVRWPGHLDEFVENIRDILEEYVTKDLERVPLRSKDMAALLRRLAVQGHPFHEALRFDILGDDFPGFAGAERIQVVAAEADAFFPIEFVYDLPSPAPNAKLCPDAEDALRTGRCETCRTRPADEQRRYVCPLGFWGLSKVIERHQHTRERADEVRRSLADYQLSTDPVSGRNTIGPISRVVFAASTKVDAFRKGTVTQVAGSLRALAKDGFGDARTWATWKKRVAAIDPQLLVILPHTVPIDDAPGMEVGKAARLPLGAIMPEYVKKRADATPIVLLIGCETGAQDLVFQELPTRIRQTGAAIVLATLTSILGRHAAPVAIALATSLVTMSTQEKRSFGDVMHGVRRQALLDGNPMVLALTAYGDADWQFGTQE